MRCAVLAGLLLGLQVTCSQAIAVKSALRSGLEMDVDTDALTDENEAADEAQQTGLRTDLDAQDMAGMLSDLDADDSSVIGDEMIESDASVTLPPELRKQAFDWQYTADFWVEINMTRARETGMALGLAVESDEDWKPVHVWRVKKNGLVQEWNNAHPDKMIIIKDEILQVNHIQWHHNATAFQDRIVGQVHAAKKGIPGSREMLSLHIVRPRQQSQKLYQLQREDRHNKLYAAEFEAKIPLPAAEILATMRRMRRMLFGSLEEEPARDALAAQEMGWTLNSTVDWMPVSILKIEPLGILAKWNEHHPDSMILEGDEILAVNKVAWHHNSTVFMTRIWQQYANSRDVPELDRTFSLAIRRPRPVQELYDQQHPIEVYEASRNVTLEINLPGSSLSDLGWKLGTRNDLGRVTVTKIEEAGAIDMWNRAHPEDEIRVGDQLSGIDVGFGKPVSAAMFLDADNFLQVAEKMAHVANVLDPDHNLLTLTVEKKFKSTRRLSAPQANAVAVAGPDVDGGATGSGWLNDTGAKKTENLSDDGFVGAEEDP